MEDLKYEEIIEKLRDDSYYYGEFGRQFLSNSNIGTLIENPFDLYKETEITPPLVLGRYFHTSILEPEKLDSFVIVDASTRNTKIYKDAAEGSSEPLLLRSEVENLEKMKEALLINDTCRNLIRPIDYKYEEPNVKMLFDTWFKGKADILNYDDNFIVDIKTTSNILNFRSSAYKYNYDSQAWIYRQLFGMDMLYIAIDKQTHLIGIFECSEDFYTSGMKKVELALDNYNNILKKTEKEQYYLFETL